MITRNWRLTEYRGLSTDTKPKKANNGAVFVEMDTQKVFFYDAENKRWIAPFDGVVEDVPEEPIAYSYNGTVLPALPEWDKEKYPYAYIYNGNGGYFLSVAKTRNNPTMGGEGIELITFKNCIRYMVEGGEWLYLNDKSQMIHYLQTTDICWVNETIYHTNGTIFMSATEPVPVYE